MEGIDIAGVGAPRIDWDQLRRSGRSFVFARACYKMTPDRAFADYWPAIKEAGLVRGAYLFWDPRLDPQDVSRRFFDVVGPLGAGDLPPVIDVEFPNGIATTGLSRDQVLNNLRAVVAAFEAHLQISPFIYTSRRVWVEELGNPRNTGLARCPLWVARYSPTEPPCPDEWGNGNWWVHQYAGDSTNVPGVSGKADVDRFNPIKEGDTGARVAFVRTKLLLPSEGSFDETVLDAVHELQRAHGLSVDGVIGPVTWSHLVWQTGDPTHTTT
jgi:lysozyme